MGAMRNRIRNLKKMCHNDISDDCRYLEYERGKENRSDWSAPTRYKLKWIKKNDNSRRK